jgi:hypothetical protein
MYGIVSWSFLAYRRSLQRWHVCIATLFKQKADQTEGCSSAFPDKRKASMGLNLFFPPAKEEQGEGACQSEKRLIISLRFCRPTSSKGMLHEKPYPQKRHMEPIEKATHMVANCAGILDTTSSFGQI